jgi:hypothetical protein
MRTDREMLELAAKAAGLKLADEIDSYIPGSRALWVIGPGGRDAVWQPLGDDGDTMRLAHTAGLRINFNYCTGPDKRRGIGVWAPGDDSHYPPFWTMYGKKPDMDVRGTILRAAAHVGATKEA